MKWQEFQRLQKVVELQDHFLSYVDEGVGHPVVLLHGIPVWGYLWHDMLPALAARHRVLIPDLMGFGYSDKGDDFDRSIARQAEWIDAWLEKLQIPDAIIVGHDIGGGVALRLATLFPERVKRLCLMNTVCYDSWPIEVMLQFGHPDTNRNLSASTALTMLRQALKKGFATSPDGHVLDGLLAPYRTEVGKLSLIRNATALNTNLTTEISGRLTRLECPTLILWGEDDKFQLLKFGERLAWDIPGPQLQRIHHARHFGMIDQPEQTRELLLEFLEDSGKRTARPALNQRVRT